MDPPTDVRSSSGASGPGGRTAVAPRPGGVGTASDRSDRELIERVRAGDGDAYGVLYERHVGAARRLAGRLCRDPHEADDVVSEVFANTLRALRRGHGPRDDLKPYVLRSLRHTIVNLRTRTDTARATPATDAELERPAVDEPVHFADAVSHAFVELPPRFQDVLWMTCVDGHTPVEVGRAADMEPGAVTSLTHRARRALGRSYLSVATRRPHVPARCAPIRELLPTYVQGNAAAATARRVHEHLGSCADCSSVSTEMTHLNKSLASVSLIALVRSLIRRWRGAVRGAAAGFGSGVAAPLATMLVATVTLLGGGASLADERSDVPRRDADTASGTDLVRSVAEPAARVDRPPDGVSGGDGAGVERAPVGLGAELTGATGAPLAPRGGADATTLDPSIDPATLDLAALDLAALDLSGVDVAVLAALLERLGLDPALLDGLDLSALDLSALDLSALDLSALDLSALDLSAVDPAVLDELLAQLGLEPAQPSTGGSPVAPGLPSAPVDPTRVVGPTAPDLPAPSSPAITVPDATVPDVPVPDATVPDATVPDATVPDATVPDITVPDVTVPDVTVPDVTVPAVTLPEPTVPPPTTLPGGGSLLP